jgi:hypothetical protein
MLVDEIGRQWAREIRGDRARVVDSAGVWGEVLFLVSGRSGDGS